MSRMTPETGLKHAIKDYLSLKGVFWWYNLAGIGAMKGIPDMFALRGGKLYAIEVKAPKGVLSGYQTEFLAAVESAGGVSVVARSLDDIIKYIP